MSDTDGAVVGPLLITRQFLSLCVYLVASTLCLFLVFGTSQMLKILIFRPPDRQRRESLNRTCPSLHLRLHEQRHEHLHWKQLIWHSRFDEERHVPLEVLCHFPLPGMCCDVDLVVKYLFRFLLSLAHQLSRTCKVGSGYPSDSTCLYRRPQRPVL